MLLLLRRRARALPAAAGFAAAATTGLAVATARCDEAKRPPARTAYADCMAPGTGSFPALEYGDGSWEQNWDGRAPPASAPDGLKRRLRRAPTRHLILIRHGQYDLKSETDPPLTELGREQAAKTGAHLAKWGVRPPPPSPPAHRAASHSAFCNNKMHGPRHGAWCAWWGGGGGVIAPATRCTGRGALPAGPEGRPEADPDREHLLVGHAAVCGAAARPPLPRPLLLLIPHPAAAPSPSSMQCSARRARRRPKYPGVWGGVCGVGGWEGHFASHRGTFPSARQTAELIAAALPEAELHAADPMVRRPTGGGATASTVVPRAAR